MIDGGIFLVILVFGALSLGFILAVLSPLAKGFAKKKSAGSLSEGEIKEIKELLIDLKEEVKQLRENFLENDERLKQLEDNYRFAENLLEENEDENPKLSP